MLTTLGGASQNRAVLITALLWMPCCVRCVALRRDGDLSNPSDLMLAVEEFLMYLNSAPIVWEFEPVLLFNKSKAVL